MTVDRKVFPLRSRAGITTDVIIEDDGSIHMDDSDLASDFSGEVNRRIEAAAATAGLVVGGGRVELPAGTYTVNRTIVLRNHVSLVGAGVGTVLVAGENLNSPVIANAAQSDRFITIENLRIDGNKENQSVTTTCHGIALDLDDVAGDEYADTYWQIRNVVVTDCAASGVSLAGRGEGYAHNLVIRDCDDVGILIDTPDCTYHNVRVSGSGKQGFYVDGANNTFTNCKAFYSGLVDGSVGHGFHVIDGSFHNTFSACEAQDNNFHGWFIEASMTSLFGCIADSNNAGHGGDTERNGNGIQITAASNCQIFATCRDRAANTHVQKHALGCTTDADGLTADIKSSGNGTGHLAVGTLSRMNISVNNYRGRTSQSFSSTITPNPTDGSYIVVGTLTGNIQVNAPATTNTWPGCEMTLEFTQNGTGNFTVTFPTGSGNYRSNFTATVTASKTSIVTFVHNGSRWIQKNAQLDIT